MNTIESPGGRIGLTDPRVLQVYDTSHSLFAMDTQNLDNRARHIFVCSAAGAIATAGGVDPRLVQVAALTHEYRGVAESMGDPGRDAAVRASVLEAAGFRNDQVTRVQRIVLEAVMSVVGSPTDGMTAESRVLGDALAAYETHPVTLVRMTQGQLRRVSLGGYAAGFVERFGPRIEEGTLFSTRFAQERYQEGAEASLGQWQVVAEALDTDDAVRNMIVPLV